MLLATVLGAACNDNEAPAAAPTAVSPTEKPLPTLAPTLPPPTPIPPTPTPTEPMAAQVNGQPIFLAAFERELARYEQAQIELGATPGADGVNYRALVLETLIERELIAQAAAGRGIVIASETVVAKLAELEAAAGDTGNFDAWLEANQWTREEFHNALSAEMLTGEIVTAVTADVPVAVEQVRVSYLQVDDLVLAESLLQQIRDGGDFATLANQHSLDRITAAAGGDLGFFARGSLLVSAVEEAAFALEPGMVSEIIAVEGADKPTYYLVQVVERDPQRPLSADMRYTMLQQAFESWLDGLWQDADIAQFIDT
ncbi:MAG: hypothetical protein GY803_24175 [Chloroflexi bacterium]|nr:hypothetical protein [Chloroflexota bacterium]